MKKLNSNQVIKIITSVLPDDSVLYATCQNYYGFYLSSEDFENDNEFAHQESCESFENFIFRVVCMLVQKGHDECKEMKKQGVTEIWDYSHAQDIEINAAIYVPEVNFEIKSPNHQSA